jgi:peptidoglycan/LPS O-acetylase OafA/YrhL
LSTAAKVDGHSILPGVQYLRGLCALLVVISHENGFLGFGEYFAKLVLPSLHEAAVFAVAVFFAISGFIIVVTSLDCQLRPGMSAATFLRRRCVRILPFLWLCTIGYNILSWAGTGYFDVNATLRTLVLWPLGELKPNVAWSLRHELLFYGIYAAAVLRWPGARGLVVAWILAVPAACLILFHTGLIPVGARLGAFYELFKLVAMGGDNGANLQFGAGMVLGLCYLSPAGRGLMRPRSPALMVLAMVAASAAIVAWPLSEGLVRVGEWTALSMLIVWAAVSCRHDQGWLARGGLALGNSSFSLYLVHNPVMLIILAVTMRLGFRFEAPGALALFLTFAVLVSVGVGLGVHILIERPLIRYVDRLVRPRRTSS